MAQDRGSVYGKLVKIAQTLCDIKPHCPGREMPPSEARRAVNYMDRRLGELAHRVRTVADSLHTHDAEQRAQQAEAENARLQREVEVLRFYGNNDCTSMADEALAIPRESEPDTSPEQGMGYMAGGVLTGEPGERGARFYPIEPASSAGGEKCDTCGRRYPTIYRVPNDVWQLIAPRQDMINNDPSYVFGGLLCVDCAWRASKSQGITLYFDASVGDWPENIVPPTPEKNGDALAAFERLLPMDDLTAPYGLPPNVDVDAWNRDREIVRRHTASGVPDEAREIVQQVIDYIDSKPAQPGQRSEVAIGWVNRRLKDALAVAPSASGVPEDNGVFLCAKCGYGSEEHGMSGHPANECVADMRLHSCDSASDDRVPYPINVVFDGPPSATSGRFVEVETDDGSSVRVGEWIEREDGLWSLRIDCSGVPYVPEREELSDERIRDMLAENKMFRKSASISYTRWRDGIDVQMPTLEMTRFTRAVWNEALAAASPHSGVPTNDEALDALDELCMAAHEHDNQYVARNRPILRLALANRGVPEEVRLLCDNVGREANQEIDITSEGWDFGSWEKGFGEAIDIIRSRLEAALASAPAVPAEWQQPAWRPIDTYPKDQGVYRNGTRAWLWHEDLGVCWGFMDDLDSGFRCDLFQKRRGVWEVVAAGVKAARKVHYWMPAAPAMPEPPIAAAPTHGGSEHE